MSMAFPRPRVLPATIGVMALLMALKSIGLMRALTTGDAVAAEPPPAAASSPIETPPTPAMATTATPRVPPAPAAVAPPPVSDAERSLLLDLRHRRDLLDARERDAAQRDAVMAAAEQKLAVRVAELNALQAKLESLEAARQSHDSANWTSLVHIYEAMKPRDAATIFDALDMQVLLGVLDRMSERKVAPILAAMQPERARLATQLLAELRTRAVTPAGDKPPQSAPDPKG
jgi:flagellar motility protein MotE (MotC chaperone)